MKILKLKIIKFILVGYLFAEVIEFQFNILVTKNYGNFIFTLFYYPILLALVYFFSKLIDKIFKNKRIADVIYYLTTSAFGLFVMEWAIIGNSPWGNPDAHQIGMWSFWAAISFMPRIFIDQRPEVAPLKKKIVRYFTIYTILTLALGVLLPYPFRLIPIIWGVIIGYTAMHIFYWKYLKNVIPAPHPVRGKLQRESRSLPLDPRVKPEDDKGVH